MLNTGFLADLHISGTEFRQRPSLGRQSRSRCSSDPSLGIPGQSLATPRSISSERLAVLALSSFRKHMCASGEPAAGQYHTRAAPSTSPGGQMNYDEPLRRQARSSEGVGWFRSSAGGSAPCSLSLSEGGGTGRDGGGPKSGRGSHPKLWCQVRPHRAWICGARRGAASSVLRGGAGLRGPERIWHAGRAGGLDPLRNPAPPRRKAFIAPSLVQIRAPNPARCQGRPESGRPSLAIVGPFFRCPCSTS